MMEHRINDPWGAWRGGIAERLASCADYLSRCQRSLAGEIAPDRHYFEMKARALRDAAIGLVQRCSDVERWLCECGAEFQIAESGDDGLAVSASCALPAG